MNRQNKPRRLAAERLGQILVLLLAGLFLVGCNETIYQILLTPKDDGLQRQLTAWIDRGETNESLPPEELERIAGAYGEIGISLGDGKTHFQSDFSSRMPDDVGGWGTYERWTSLLGSTALYMERFRGSKEIAAGFDARRRKAHVLVDLVVGWLDSQWHSMEGFDRLRRFIDKELRSDVEYLFLSDWVHDYVTLGEGAGSFNLLGFDDDQTALTLQHLLERGYFTTEDWPLIVELDGTGDMESGTIMDRYREWVARFLAAKMNVASDAPLPSEMSILWDPNGLESSLTEFVRQTPPWAVLAAKHPDASGGDLIGSVVREASGAARESAQDQDSGVALLRVTLHVASEPFWTNGSWDEDQGIVTWSRSVGPRGEAATDEPLLLYAQWSAPDEAFQVLHFGRVFLAGVKLSEYCFWRESLPEGSAQEWDSFLAELRPGPGLAEALTSFEFTVDSGAAASASSPSASTARSLLLDALEIGRGAEAADTANTNPDGEQGEPSPE